MIYTFLTERCSDLPVSVCCRVMKVSTSGYYQRQREPVTDGELTEAWRANTVFDIWKMSRHSYGMPRIRDELRLGRAEGCSRTTVARLMGICGAVGIHYRRRGSCTRPGDGEVSDDLVNRSFDPDGPDRLWCMDVTEHPTGDGKVYLAVVLDAFSRRVVGWSIADHMRAELVADAVQMATWRRRPPPGQTIAHSDHGGQYTSWLFGTRLRAAGILGSMGSIGDCFDNSVAEAFFSSLQRELLDQHQWKTRSQLAIAIFEWIECWYNTHRRHSYCDGLSPIDYETAQAA
ncbi:MAG TPA: IS3 family transposase [Ilumatobacteraceae bacterium]